MLTSLRKSVCVATSSSVRFFSGRVPANTFWAVELKPGQPVEATIPKGSVLVVNLAALTGGGAKASVVKVNVTFADAALPPTNAVLCTLKSNTCEQFSFESLFSDKTKSVFVVDGDADNTIHLSGFFRVNDDIYDQEYGLTDEDYKNYPYDGAPPFDFSDSDDEEGDDGYSAEFKKKLASKMTTPKSPAAFNSAATQNKPKQASPAASSTVSSNAIKKSTSAGGHTANSGTHSKVKNKFSKK